MECTNHDSDFNKLLHIEVLKEELLSLTAQLDAAVQCISDIKKHQQIVAGSMHVNSSIMKIINNWEKQSLKDKHH